MLVNIVMMMMIAMIETKLVVGVKVRISVLLFPEKYNVLSLPVSFVTLSLPFGLLSDIYFVQVILYLILTIVYTYPTILIR